MNGNGIFFKPYQFCRRTGVFLLVFFAINVNYSYATEFKDNEPSASKKDLFINSSAPVSGRILNEKTILPADVFARLRWFQRLLQVLAQHMGHSINQQALVDVHHIEPREVIFQAHALRIKTHRLALQLGVGSQAVPALSKFKIQTVKPYHVFYQADQAVKSIQQIIDHFGLAAQIQEYPAHNQLQPSDVYALALTIHRNLNQLLITPILQSDVYALVTQAVHLCANLISPLAGMNPYPEPEPINAALVTDKMVYQKVLSLQKKLVARAVQTNAQHKQKFQEKPTQGTEQSISASDSYDVMLWILAELFYRQRSDSSSESVPIYYPGIKFPQDTLQRLSILEQQIIML